MSVYRILIVGGGPVGLACALELAEAGHLVSVIEAQDWPKDKVCGEGIMPLGLKFLAHHKLIQKLNPNGMSRFTGIRYLDGETQAFGQFKNECGLGIRRTELSRVLFQAASRHVRINLYAKTRLIGLLQNEDHIEVTCASEDLKQWQGDFVVGADGIHSKVRKLLGINHESLSARQRLGGRLHLEVPSHGLEEVQVYWSNGAEAYLTPCGPDRLEIAFMWERSLYRGSALELEAFLWRQFSELKARYEQCPRLSDFSYQGGFAARSEVLNLNRVVLVGDAAYFYDGITGKGLALGFQMARWLRLSLERGNFSYYVKKAERAMSYNIYLTHLVLSLSRSQTLRRYLFKLLNWGIFDFMVRLIGQGELEAESNFSKKAKLAIMERN